MPLARSKTSLAPSRHCVQAWATGCGTHEGEQGLEGLAQIGIVLDLVEDDPELGGRDADARQLREGRDRVLLLLQGRDGRDDEVVEVLVAAAVLAHERQQLFHVAGADVDDDVGDGLQIFLQLAELAAAQRARLAVVGVDALDGDDFGASDARSQEMAGDRRLADIARETNDGHFHWRSLLEREGW